MNRMFSPLIRNSSYHHEDDDNEKSRNQLKQTKNNKENRKKEIVSRNVFPMNQYYYLIITGFQEEDSFIINDIDRFVRVLALFFSFSLSFLFSLFGEINVDEAVFLQIEKKVGHELDHEEDDNSMVAIFVMIMILRKIPWNSFQEILEFSFHDIVQS